MVPSKFNAPADVLEVRPRWNVIAIARDVSASGLLHKRNHVSPRPINPSQAQDTDTPAGGLQPKNLLLRINQQAVNRMAPIKWRSLAHLLSTLISKDADSADVSDVQRPGAGAHPLGLNKVFDSLGKDIFVAVFLSRGCHADQQTIELLKETEVRLIGGKI